MARTSILQPPLSPRARRRCLNVPRSGGTGGGTDGGGGSGGGCDGGGGVGGSGFGGGRVVRVPVERVGG